MTSQRATPWRRNRWLIAISLLLGCLLLATTLSAAEQETETIEQPDTPVEANPDESNDDASTEYPGRITEADMSEMERCITIRRIDSIKVVDKKTLMFKLSGRKVYLNHLPRKCSALRDDSVFQYEARGGRLCNHDLVTVLERFGGGFTPGMSCGLGLFEEIPHVDVLKEEIEAKE